ncbi:bifunctional 4-hydroxy-2-oxoglutarate aldolase/2-dehydro-3-deoxy-phosphogluconate aldolase [Leifsonia sp. ZF2019]|uniref:bifunctional 4-hydroxy-2-oxoglutarate aldolase/2-dehydro-3-deoxy-phosphogluconate aldolase n=1 Tax=Leifsonia sp. ZF2019 TaxID=2781978 RepID=UPI001CC01B79|nr:bifunctional 4-hydroxy-2-oxoglutarate aldolase/2-dehydro-3-deoxy-phosphogluconate aldolase [Leifsonia sp. ZF2019]UAJ78833.1 bifunctional 4-hydroxy-2-oxoglutarate aldolase/2-dehydro-3-deoxy-phosphogluconate aldolase [Leifsonia sp. ZF2019]
MRPGPASRRLIAVLRAEHASAYRPVVRTLVECGIREIELTLTTPETLRDVRSLREEFGRDASIGVGTVTSEELARRALDAGAQFLVTPGLVPGVPASASRLGVPTIMGALTPTEVLAATNAGADAVKIFPASAVGPGYLRQLRGPFPSLAAIPSGGVEIADADGWFAAGAVAVSMGGPLIGDALAGGSLAELRERAARLVAAAGGVGTP